MTNAQLNAWSNGPVTRQNLQAACAAHGLATTGTIADLRTRLQAHLATLPTDALAAWNPPIAPAPAAAAPAAAAGAAPAPAPAAPAAVIPAPVAPAPVVVNNHPAWMPIGMALLGVAGVIVAVAFAFWLLRQPSPTSTASRNDTITVKVDPIKVEPIQSTGLNAGNTASPSAPAASQTPVVASTLQPSGSTNTSTSIDPIVIDTLNDGRSYEPRSTLPLAELGFSPYEDTGIGRHKTWTLPVPEGWTAIAMGVKVNGSDRGNINAYKGPATVSLDIVDGAYVVKPNDQAQGEFCTRWAQHKANGWLSQHLRPLPEWGNRPCA